MDDLFAYLEDGLDYDRDGVIPSAGVVMMAISTLVILAAVVACLGSVGIDLAGWSWPIDGLRLVPDKIMLSLFVGNLAFLVIGSLLAAPIIWKAANAGRTCPACGHSRD